MALLFLKVWYHEVLLHDCRIHGKKVLKPCKPIWSLNYNLMEVLMKAQLLFVDIKKNEKYYK